MNKSRINYHVFIIIMVFSLFCCLQKMAVAIEVNSLARDFTLKSVDDDNIRLHELRGSVVVIKFLSHRCGSCVASLTELDQLYKKYKGQDFIVLGIQAPRVLSSLSEPLNKARKNLNSNVVILETESATAIASNRVTEDIVGKLIASAKQGNIPPKHLSVANVSFPILFDNKSEVQKIYRINDKPLMVLIDRFGYQRFFYQEQASAQKDSYQLKIESLLAQKVY